jgi:hypothetical protein
MAQTSWDVSIDSADCNISVMAHDLIEAYRKQPKEYAPNIIRVNCIGFGAALYDILRSAGLPVESIPPSKIGDNG